MVNTNSICAFGFFPSLLYEATIPLNDSYWQLYTLSTINKTLATAYSLFSIALYFTQFGVGDAPLSLRVQSDQLIYVSDINIPNCCVPTL